MEALSPGKMGNFCPLLAKGHFGNLQKINPNSSLLLQGMAIKHSLPALHTDEDKILAKLHPFLRMKVWGFGVFFCVGFFEKFKSYKKLLVKQSSDAKKPGSGVLQKSFR